MPRASKRKSEAVKSSNAEPAPKKARTKEAERIDNFYALYANPSLGMIDPEGVEKLCSGLRVAHTDVRILMLAWKMNAKKQGYFTQDEWQTGLKALRVDSLRKLKNALPQLEKELAQQKAFEDFYCYSFHYCLTEDKQKTLDIDTVCVLLGLLLGSRFRLQVDLFTKYLKIQREYKGVNMDQWINFLRFCQEIRFPDVQNYDACQAWPLILDNFVDWVKEKSTKA